MKKKLLLAAVLFSLINPVAFSAEKSSVKKDDGKETSQALEDLKRFEIITLGSMPFVSMDISLGYTAYMNIVKGDKTVKISPFGSYKYDPDPDNENKKFNWDDFKKSDCGKMIAATVCTSLILGTVDFTVNLIKRNSIKARNSKNGEKNIIITDLENDPDATKLALPESYKKNDGR